MAQSRFSAVIGPQAFPFWPYPHVLKDVPASSPLVRYQAGHGPDSYVTLQWCKGIPAKDTTTQILSQLNKLPGLYQEQVRGQKVEEEIILPPGSFHPHLIPGGIFGSQELLRHGKLTYSNPERTMACVLHHPGGRPAGQAVSFPAREVGCTARHPAIKAFQSQGNAIDHRSLPNRSCSSEMRWSTCQDGMGFNISGAYFFLGDSERKPIAFSSENYHYLYIYTFEQIFFTAKPKNSPSATAGTENQPIANDEELVIQEVKFGRRINLFIESKTALERRINTHRCGLEWIMLSAKLQEPSFTKSIKHDITFRLQTQEGRIFNISEGAHLQASIDAYFESTCTENPLSPLAFQVKDLDGTPVSLLTTAYINSRPFPC
jgi:hypothetical protein